MNEHFAVAQAAHRRAVELAQGAPAALNIAPLIELVRTAYSMGYELRRMSDGEIQAMRLSPHVSASP